LEKTIKALDHVDLIYHSKSLVSKAHTTMCITGVAKLRLPRRMQLWGFRKIVFYFYFYCKV